MAHRPLYEIAEDIRADYRSKDKQVYYAAKPYVDAMASLNQVTDSYGYDSGRSVVAYAISNLSHWRGETAKRVKDELRAIRDSVK